MKTIGFFVISTLLVVLLNNVSLHAGVITTGMAREFKSSVLSGVLAKIVGAHYGVTREALQQLSEQYDSLHESLSSQPFNAQVEQQFHAFRSALDEVGATRPAEAMLYIAALAGNRDAGAVAISMARHEYDSWVEDNFSYIEALELAIWDGLNWDALEFMVDLDRSQAQHGLDVLISEEIKRGNKKVARKLIEIGANPAGVLAAAARKKKKKLAARAIEVGADVHQALYEIDGKVKAGKFLIKRGADANLALLGFASKHTAFATMSEQVGKEFKADKLIEVFGADPLLVSMYTEEDTLGSVYLSEIIDKYSPPHTRAKLIKQTEGLVAKLESLTPSEAKLLIEEGANVDLALLYLARDKNMTMAKYLIDKFDADSATVASLAQAGGEEDTATFLRELAE